ncbi:MAG: N4-gp56 family major capsid protein [Myxococcales bacterium]|nr:N4-gp56 family major capsid protein [Myxococcales bacterium]
MADGTTTYGVISQRTAAWAATVMLRHAEPILVLQKFGTPKEMPRNKANVVKFRRPIPFTDADTPLVEGVTPTAQKMAYEDVSATMRQYGKPIEITDVVQDLSEDPVLKDAAILAGEGMAGHQIQKVEIALRSLKSLLLTYHPFPQDVQASVTALGFQSIEDSEDDMLSPWNDESTGDSASRPSSSPGH